MHPRKNYQSIFIKNDVMNHQLAKATKYSEENKHWGSKLEYIIVVNSKGR